jgi:hypothetical protein
MSFAKCNLDAKICMTNNKVGVRACIRDEKGNFIAAMTSNKECVILHQKQKLGV